MAKGEEMDTVIMVGLGLLIILVNVLVCLFLVRRVEDCIDLLEEDKLSFMEIFNQKMADILGRYVEERRTIEWLDELLEKGEFDIRNLSTDAEKRAYAMMLIQAEDALAVRLATARQIEEAVAEKQYQINQAALDGSSSLTKIKITQINELKRQQAKCHDHLKDAERRLRSLTNPSEFGLPDEFEVPNFLK